MFHNSKTGNEITQNWFEKYLDMAWENAVAPTQAIQEIKRK